MIINHNMSALNAHRQLGANNTAVSKSLEKLSSGLKINRAGDDAAGLAISEKMRGQIKGLEMASKNAQDGISLIQTAEGALNETHAILQRMRELSVQSSNDTNNDNDRGELQKEMDQLSEELTRISDNTEFNTKGLLDGSFEGTFHIGANKGQSLKISINEMGAEALKVNGTLTEGEAAEGFEVDGESFTGNVLQRGDTVVAVEAEDGKFYAVDDVVYNEDDTEFDAKSGAVALDVTVENGEAIYGGIDISSQTSANSAIETIQGAIDTVSAERSKLGAFQNRLEHTINNLGTSAENLTAAESRIRDVDMAKEMMNFTKNNILSQAAQSMIAQANQQPQGVLQLLR